jgi:hypothetical protein
MGDLNAADGRGIGGRRLSAVEVAAPAPAVRLGPELPLELHQAPDPGAVGAEVRLDLGGQLADGGQVDAEQLRAPLQRRRDRPTQLRVVPGPHAAQHIEHKFEEESGTVRSPTGSLRAWVGRAGAATQRTLGDSRGQQGITNLEVSGRSQRLAWGAKLLDWAFTRQRPQVGERTAAAEQAAAVRTCPSAVLVSG